jgi:serine protease Do
MKKLLGLLSSCLLILGVASIGFYYVYVHYQFLSNRQQHMTREMQRISAQARAVHVRPSGPLWAELQKEMNNAVVQIITDVAAFNWFEPYKTPDQHQTGGSGFFIDAKGHIVTNYHVVKQAKTISIRLPFIGKKKFDAHVVGASPDRDIALLRLEPDGFEEIKKKLGGSIPYLVFGDSDIVARAHDVMALGYPLNQPNLKSTIGNVSGRERIMRQHFIQITAPINPGNSGGPAVNASGDVIGICTAGIPAAQNVGYIIPINDIKSAIKDLFKVKLLRSPVLGLGCIFLPTTPELIEYLGNPPEGGWYISRVFKNTLLEKSGIQDGDMIYKVNGYKVDVYGDISVPWSDGKVSLLDLLNRYVVGDKVHLVVYRRGERKEFTFTLEPRFLLPIRRMYPDFEKIDYEVIGGMVVMELTLNHLAILLDKLPHLSPVLARYARPDYQYEPALIVTNVLPDSPAKRAKMLSVGVFIHEVNDQPVINLDQFRKAVKKSQGMKYLKIKSKDENRLIILRVKDILKEENRLAAQYFYKKSSLIEALS